MSVKIQTHLIGDIIMYFQIEAAKMFWPMDQRLEFVNILKSINQENVKVMAYTISKNSIHLMFFSQDIEYIQSFIQIFKDQVIQFLKSEYTTQRPFFRKNPTFKVITGREEFLKYIMLFQQIPLIKKSRKEMYNDPVTSYKEDINLLQILQIQELFNLTILDIRRFLKTVDFPLNIATSNYNMRKGIIRYMQENQISIKEIVSASYETKKLFAYLILNNYHINRHEIAKELRVGAKTLHRLLISTIPYIKHPLTKKGIARCLNY